MLTNSDLNKYYGSSKTAFNSPGTRRLVISLPFGFSREGRGEDVANNLATAVEYGGAAARQLSRLIYSREKNEHFSKVHQQLYLLELRSMITGFNSNSSISKSYDRNKSAADFLGLYLTQGQIRRSFLEVHQPRSISSSCNA